MMIKECNQLIRKTFENEKQEIKCNNIIKYVKMIKFDDITKEIIKEHNANWPQIPDHYYRMLITGGSESGKTNTLFNSVSQQLDIDKIYLYVIDPYKAKYYFLINKRENKGLKHVNNSKAFIKYSNNLFIKILKNTIQTRDKKY